MKKKQFIKMALLTFVGFFCFTSCKKTNEPKPLDRDVTFTQQSLDNAAKKEYLLNIKNDPFGAFNNGEKFGSTDPAIYSKIRDCYSNIGAAETIKAGSVFFRRAFRIDSLGNKTNPINTVIMVKHLNGYYKEGGDYEYINYIYPKGSKVDPANPNGLLPSTDSTIYRGSTSMAKCAGCHSQAPGGDFLFTR